MFDQTRTILNPLNIQPKYWRIVPTSVYTTIITNMWYDILNALYINIVRHVIKNKLHITYYPSASLGPGSILFSYNITLLKHTRILSDHARAYYGLL